MYGRREGVEGRGEGVWGNMGEVEGGEGVRVSMEDEVGEEEHKKTAHSCLKFHCECVAYSVFISRRRGR